MPRYLSNALLRCEIVSHFKVISALVDVRLKWFHFSACKLVKCPAAVSSWHYCPVTYAHLGHVITTCWCRQRTIATLIHKDMSRPQNISRTMKRACRIISTLFHSLIAAHSKMPSNTGHKKPSDRRHFVRINVVQRDIMSGGGHFVCFPYQCASRVNNTSDHIF